MRLVARVRVPRSFPSRLSGAGHIRLKQLAAGLLLLLAACGRLPTTAPEPVDLDSPPEATLRIGDQIQMAGIGTHCWGEPMICVDMIGVPTVPEPLMIASPMLASFEIAFPEEPVALNLAVAPIDTSDQVEATSDLRWWRFEQAQNYPLSAARETSLDLDLEPGLYVFVLFAAWETRGDVIYGFLIEVS